MSAAGPAPSFFTLFRPRRGSAQVRWSLWALLIALVAALLVTLVWLAGRYEASQVQSKLERDTADALVDIRAALTRNVQSLQALQSRHLPPAVWKSEAARAVARASRVAPDRMARQRAGHRRLRGHAVSRSSIRPPGPGQCAMPTSRWHAPTRAA